MVPKKPFISQKICCIVDNGERKLRKVSAYIKDFLGILKVENKKCHRCSKLKTPVELFTDKPILFLDGLQNSNSPWQIDHPKCTILVNDTVVLDLKFQKYFLESLLEDVICENISPDISE